MIIGHYGVAYIVKKKASDIPLWLLFASVQFLDISAFSLVLLRIEKASFTPIEFVDTSKSSFLPRALRLQFRVGKIGIIYGKK